VRRHGWPFTEARFWGGGGGVGLAAAVGRTLSAAAAAEHRHRPSGPWTRTRWRSFRRCTAPASVSASPPMPTAGGGRTAGVWSAPTLRGGVDCHRAGVAKPDPRIFRAVLEAKGAATGRAPLRGRYPRRGRGRGGGHGHSRGAL